jgi:hypothetical protein
LEIKKLSEIDDIMPEVRKLLEKVFEAGREDLRRELSQVLGHRLLKGHVHNMKREPNHTVRPAIIALVESSNGISASNVTKTTGFKDNTVRTTLSMLRNDGLVEQRGTLWFPRISGGTP